MFSCSVCKNLYLTSCGKASHCSLTMYLGEDLPQEYPKYKQLCCLWSSFSSGPVLVGSHPALRPLAHKVMPGVPSCLLDPLVAVRWWRRGCQFLLSCKLLPPDIQGLRKSFNEPARETESPIGKNQQETVTRKKTRGEKEVKARNRRKKKTETMQDRRQAQGCCFFIAVPRKGAWMDILPSGCWGGKVASSPWPLIVWSHLPVQTRVA